MTGVVTGGINVAMKKSMAAVMTMDFMSTSLWVRREPNYSAIKLVAIEMPVDKGAGSRTGCMAIPLSRKGLLSEADGGRFQSILFKSVPNVLPAQQEGRCQV